MNADQAGMVGMMFIGLSFLAEGYDRGALVILGVLYSSVAIIHAYTILRSKQ